MADENNEQINSIPDEYKPISMWGYFGYQLLFAVPCIGFIVALVFAFGGTTNINLKNFARGYLCFVVIIFIISFLVSVVSGLGFVSVLSSLSSSSYY